MKNPTTNNNTRTTVKITKLDELATLNNYIQVPNNPSFLVATTATAPKQLTNGTWYFRVAANGRNNTVAFISCFSKEAPECTKGQLVALAGSFYESNQEDGEVTFNGKVKNFAEGRTKALTKYVGANKETWLTAVSGAITEVIGQEGSAFKVKLDNGVIVKFFSDKHEKLTQYLTIGKKIVVIGKLAGDFLDVWRVELRGIVKSETATKAPAPTVQEAVEDEIYPELEGVELPF